MWVTVHKQVRSVKISDSEFYLLCSSIGQAHLRIFAFAGVGILSSVHLPLPIAIDLTQSVTPSFNLNLAPVSRSPPLSGFCLFALVRLILLQLFAQHLVEVNVAV